MRRRPALALLAASATLLAGAGVATAATSPGVGVTVPGLGQLAVAGQTDLGVAPAARRTSVVVALAPRDAHGLDVLAGAVAAGRAAALTPGQVSARFAPTTGTVGAVRSWATHGGLRVEEVAPDRSFVRVTGPAAAMGRAFGTTLHDFRRSDGSTWTAPATAGRLPAALAAHTTAVLGLSTLGRLGLPLHRATAQPSARPAGVNDPGLHYLDAYGPGDLARLYHAPASATGAGQRVAVIASGDVRGVVADLPRFEARFGLPRVPVSVVPVGARSGDATNADEYRLDSQYATGLAPAVRELVLYAGSSLSNADLYSTVSRWVSDRRTSQASLSAGECELVAELTGFRLALDSVLRRAVVQGQTLFTSSGDSGSFCPLAGGVNGVPAGYPGPLYPAASPWAVGVGGTTVLGTDGQTPIETAWYGGGGGRSQYAPQPAYQRGVGGSDLGGQRGVPDVSLDADPESGYIVISGGMEEVIGGTSASAPAWQGIWARAQQAHAGRLGFAGASVYRAPARDFRDVTVGSTGIYPATGGYDYATGRGTPDIAALVHDAH